MDNKTTTTWIIVIIVVIIIIGLGWWYFASQNSTAPATTTTQQTQSSQDTITSFNFSGLTPQVTGAIDNTAYTVTLTVPSGTDLTTLTPTITVSPYATVSPASGAQQDFTNPVTYTVTAQDGSTQSYTVTVNVANPSS